MSLSLHDTAPGFDQPIAVLKHCHDRIRKQLATMQKLVPHLTRYGADPEAQQAALSVIKYFDKAAHLHHEDEEHDLIPMLQSCALGEDAQTLSNLVPGILQEHTLMDGLWQRLHEQLVAISKGHSPRLSADDVQQFADTYTQHMIREETHIAPMAKRLFTDSQMAQLGNAMQARRGIAPATPAEPIGEQVAHMRKDYGQASLDAADVAADPFTQFARWFDEALKAEVREPNAMGLSTVGDDGRPSSRIVLVKQFDERGFTWYTNYQSQKGQQLCANPNAALLFFWQELERQVRIEGKVVLTSAEESDTYFNSRPVKSRLSAIASAQSSPVASREAMEQAYAEAEAQWGEQPARPEYWGGYRLVPDRIEFWQGRRSRFHDRIVYTLQADGSWAIQRIQP